MRCFQEIKKIVAIFKFKGNTTVWIKVRSVQTSQLFWEYFHEVASIIAKLFQDYSDDHDNPENLTFPSPSLTIVFKKKTPVE